MKITLGQIFQLAISQLRNKMNDISNIFPLRTDDEIIKILSGKIEAYEQIKELSEFFEHCSDVPFEEVLCGYFGEEE